MRKQITPAMKLEALQKAGLHASCYICRRQVSQDQIQFDHIQALVDGGAHAAENIAVICVWCHREKSGFETSQNKKMQRLAKARAAHAAVLGGEPRPKGKIRARGFDKRWTRKLSGRVVRNADA